VPRKMIGTLTLSNLNSIYISMYLLILYKSYFAVTLKYSKPVLLINYIRVVALTPDLQVILFYNIIKFLKNSSTI